MSGERDRTLEELEGENWGDPPFASYVVTMCHAMRRKPLRDLTDEEIRLAIGQKMGLRFLMPLAVERLDINPLVAGDFYEGALLYYVLCEASGSGLDDEHLRRLDAAALRLVEAAPQMEESWREECLPALSEALNLYNSYRGR